LLAGLVTEPSEHAGVKIPPPVIFLAFLLAGVGLELLWPLGGLPLALAIACGVLGLVAWAYLDGSSMQRFRRANTALEPWKPTSALVTDGPYRFTRNPIYLGMTALYVGIALAFGVLWALILLPLVLVVIDRFVITREERYLARRFGDQYAAYRRRARRWV
jgi:protein-S-isoprenylcysteine O-methyltransferase Ste14